MPEAHAKPQTLHETMPRHPYRRLLFMGVLSFLAMYGLMYMMADSIQNVVPNVNQVYMAGMMTAAMIVIELMLMSGMYPKKKANMAIMVASTVVGMLFIIEVRTQAFVGDKQLMKSMIPHHSAAILMCEEARLQDEEVQHLCQSIVASQQAEIAWMQAKWQQP